jgi:hypothetical protein
MRSAELRVPSFADDCSLPNYDRADKRIGFNRAATAFGQFEGAIEKLRVVAHGDG